ncbi:MAG TPA: hypothetical protein VF490_08240 [Chryseosolibacter sp.]
MKTKKEIFGDILISSRTGCVLKIKLRNQKNPVITAVDSVLAKKIVLKPTCLYGFKLENRVITLSKIENVTRYETRFDNPLFEKVRFIKDNLGHLRRNFGMEGERPSGLLQEGATWRQV